MPQITPQAKAIVEKAIDNILAAPHKFDMNDWFTGTSKCGTAACLAGHIGLAAGFVKPKKQQSFPMMDAEAALKKIKRLGYEEPTCEIAGPNGVGVQRFASAVLGLSDPYDSDKLFMVDHWPQKFEDKYRELSHKSEPIEELDPKNPKQMKLRTQMAKLAVSRLKHFLKTGE